MLSVIVLIYLERTCLAGADLGIFERGVQPYIFCIIFAQIMHENHNFFQQKGGGGPDPLEPPLS